MSRITIDGIVVDFPFEPYEEQINYMQKVIQCLSGKKFGVLESPTGTGKTLSLLCSTLSWLQHQKQTDPPPYDGPPPPSNSNDEPGSFSNVQKYLFPKIIYSSRTHSQLSKAMLELRKTSFSHIKVTILGSRDQMCINPQVMMESNLTLKNSLCSMHMKMKTCHYGNNVEKVKDDAIFSTGITDIEDLVSKSHKKKCCPYYMARELQEKADIIFMPYNYLFDFHIRKALKISLVNAVVILDEAHNIDKVCEEACSVSIKSSDIALAISEVTNEMKKMFEEVETGFVMFEREYSRDDLCFVKEKLSLLESTIEELPVSKEVTITKNGCYIFDFLQSAGILFNDSQELIRILSVIYEYISQSSESNNRRGSALKKLADDLTVINSTVSNVDINKPDKDFRVFIEEEVIERSFGGFKAQKKGDRAGKVINYWCFNPGFSLNNIMTDSLRSLILTSGTLAPIDSFIKELSLSAPITLECNHIVSSEQVFVLKIDVGPRNISLKCNFANRQNVDYWLELGLTLQNFFRLIPDGVLLFFPGYATMNIAMKMWRENGLWEKLEQIKPIFVEPQQKSLLAQVSHEYYKAIDLGKGKGAVFIGVCRGKISEGLDFSDKYGRAVIVAGLPYPPLFDPKVKLKKQYIDHNKISRDDLSGDTWYVLEATKAVNQAIGRVIRHSGDYGAIILCDAQFNNQNIVQNLSKWVQKKITKARVFGESIGLLRNFFRKNQNAAILNGENRKSVQTPSFDHSSSSVSRRCETSELNSNSSFENINVRKNSSPVLSESQTYSKNLIEKIKTSSMYVPDQLLIISKILNFYENKFKLNALNDSLFPKKSCLENLDKDDTTVKAGNSSFNMLNSELYQNQNLLEVLERAIEDFGIKYYKYSEKIYLEPLPSDIFNLPSINFSAKKLNEGYSYELDEDSQKEILTTISRLHAVSKRMNDAILLIPSTSSIEISRDNLLREIGIAADVCDSPAKKRKMKLQFIKIEDIQLEGADQLTKEKEKRLNETKNFLLELKATLEPSCYSKLISLVKNFSEKKDFRETISYLQKLLPETDEELKALFKRCYLLFTGQWEKQFKVYCSEHNL